VKVSEVPPELGFGPKIRGQTSGGYAQNAGDLLYTTQGESEQRGFVVDHACDHAWTSHPPNGETGLPFMTGTLATRPSSTISIGGLCMKVPSGRGIHERVID